MNPGQVICVATALSCLAPGPAPAARRPTVTCTYTHYSVRDEATIARLSALTQSKERMAAVAEQQKLPAGERVAAWVSFNRQHMPALAAQMQSVVAPKDRAWSATFEVPLAEDARAPESKVSATIDGKPTPATVTVTLADAGQLRGSLRRLDTQQRVPLSSYDGRPTLAVPEGRAHTETQMDFGVCSCALEAPAADLPKVRAVSHWGHLEEARNVKAVAVLLQPGVTKLRLGPQVPWGFVELDGHALSLQLIDAREEVPPADRRAERRFCARAIDHCEDSESYMTLAINGHETMLLREQLKEVTLVDGYRFLIGARDIEDTRDRHPSDLVLIRFK